MSTHLYRATCPIGRKQSDPCPMHPRQAVVDPCNACLAEFEERAALIADGCRLTQPLADVEATEQLRAAVARAESKQRRLF